MDMAFCVMGALIIYGLVTASLGRAVRSWEAVTGDAALVVWARSRVFRRLTRDERRALVIPAPRPAPEGAGSPA